VAAGTAHTVHAITWLVCFQRFTEGLRGRSLRKKRVGLALTGMFPALLLLLLLNGMLGAAAGAALGTGRLP
jgi:hypothetical protein